MLALRRDMLVPAAAAIAVAVASLGVRTVLWRIPAYPSPFAAAFLTVGDMAVLGVVLVSWSAARRPVPLWRLFALGSIVLFLGLGIVSSVRAVAPALALLTLARHGLMALAAWFLATHAGVRASWRLLAGAAWGAGVVQAALAVVQFARQADFGLWRLGEQALGPGVAGVAKLVVGGEVFVRAYGTLPHPNVLAAWLLATLAASAAAYLAGFPRTPVRAAWYLAGMALMGVGLVLTFSRTAWLAGACGLAISFIVYFTQRRRVLPDAARRLVALAVLGALIVVWAIAAVPELVAERIRVPQAGEQAVDLRVSSAFMALRGISEYPLLGIGPAHATIYQLKTEGMPPESWMLQPPHAAPLLVALEYGTLGLVALALAWAFALRGVFAGMRHTHPVALAASLGLAGAFGVLALADHFFFTFAPGVMLVWGLWGLLLAQESEE